MISVAVVYESVFGNTRAIAEAVAQGVREANPDTHVEVLGVADATPDKIGAAALLVVGGPTHMRGMSKKSSRRRALHDIEDATTDNGRRREVVEGLGVREWLGALPRSATRTPGGRIRYPVGGSAGRWRSAIGREKASPTRLPRRGQAGGLRRRRCPADRCGPVSSSGPRRGPLPLHRSRRAI